MVSAYFDVKITSSFEEFNEYQGDKFYLITIFDIWSANGWDIIKTDSYCWEDIFGEEFINEVKTNKHPIFFDGSSESSVKKTFEALIDFCTYVKADPKDVYICMSNAQSVSLNLEAYPYLLSPCNLFSIDRFERDATQVGICMGGLLEKFRFKNKKRFLFTNRKYTVERAYLYFKFHQHNLLDNMHCTFRLEHIYNDDLLTLSGAIDNINICYKDPGLIEYLNTNLDTIEQSLPHTIKTNVYNTTYKSNFLYSLWNLSAHNSTDINIITETYRHYHIPLDDVHHKNFYFITEKTYRTILMKQPFILCSNPYALKHLRDAGYKTFAPYINETYDTIENLFARQNLILAEVKRISKMPQEQYDELLYRCNEIANYNYEVLMNKQKDKYSNTAWTDDFLKPYLKDFKYDLDPFHFVRGQPS